MAATRREGAPGLLRQAHGGTLFLRGGAPLAVDFALLCATHRSLAVEVEAQRFREDLRPMSTRCVQQALGQAQGNRSEAARRLGIAATPCIAS